MKEPMEEKPTRFDTFHYFALFTAWLGWLAALGMGFRDVVMISGLIVMILVIVRLLRR